jgi:hypothetical protein
LQKILQGKGRGSVFETVRLCGRWLKSIKVEVVGYAFAALDLA